MAKIFMLRGNEDPHDVVKKSAQKVNRNNTYTILNCDTSAYAVIKQGDITFMKERKEYDYTKEGMVKICGFESAEKLEDFSQEYLVGTHKEFMDSLDLPDDAVINIHNNGAALAEIVEKAALDDPQFLRLLCMQYARDMFAHMVSIERAREENGDDNATSKAH